MNYPLQTPEQDSRNSVIIRTSIIGIVANVLLAVMKAAVGLMSKSIAVVLDAVNNLSDALSSVITIVGAKLSGKQPDRKHPLGYGRIEYLSSMIVAALVLYAGITALTESIKKIIRPEAADYSILSLVLIAVAVVVKLVLGRYVKSQGEKVDSGALIASGSDASFDAILSGSVLLSAIIYLLFDISLEAWVGVIISVFIIKSGIEMMLDTVNDILGQRTDPEVSHKVKELIGSEEGVLGAYDLLLSNYGPGRNYASVHIEVPDTVTADEIDRLSRRIQSCVYDQTGIILTGISVYSHNTHNDEAAEIRDRVSEAVLAHEGVLQMHGFYIDTQRRDMRFDAVLSFDVDHKEAIESIYSEIHELYPDYALTIVPDLDISD